MSISTKSGSVTAERIRSSTEREQLSGTVALVNHEQSGADDEWAAATQPQSSAAVFRLKQGTAVEQLEDSTLLYSEQDQQIHWLNDTSGLLVNRLLSGSTEEELIGELLSHGVDRSTGGPWAHAFLLELARLGVLEGQPTASGTPSATQQVGVGSRTLALRYRSTALEQLLAPPFAHLRPSSASPDRVLDISADGDFAFIGDDEGSAGTTPVAMAAVRIKGLMLDDVLAQPNYLAALHAACLARNGKACLLLGSPGAGKTTLSLALLRQGFRYGSDDVTLVKTNGEVEGVPLAPGIKEGAWPIAGSIGYDLSDLPIHFRPDGQQVRFLPLKQENLAERCSVAAIVHLRRAPNAATALGPISPREALAELFRESRSHDGQCSAEIMRSLLEIVRTAECLELRYSEAADAAALLSARFTA